MRSICTTIAFLHFFLSALSLLLCFVMSQSSVSDANPSAAAYTSVGFAIAGSLLMIAAAIFDRKSEND